jgi:ribosome biogenesis GTPase A
MARKKNMRVGPAYRMLPDLDFAAAKFLDGFRKGKFGLFNLDSDLVAEKSRERIPY